MNHPIVGSWSYNTTTITFNANRTMTEARTYTSPNCTLTASYTFDISDTALTTTYTGFVMSDATACDTVCMNLFGRSCAQSVSSLLYFPSRTSATASVTGTVLTVNGTNTYDRQ